MIHLYILSLHLSYVNNVKGIPYSLSTELNA